MNLLFHLLNHLLKEKIISAQSSTSMKSVRTNIIVIVSQLFPPVVMVGDQCIVELWVELCDDWFPSFNNKHYESLSQSMK